MHSYFSFPKNQESSGGVKRESPPMRHASPLIVLELLNVNSKTLFEVFNV